MFLTNFYLIRLLYGIQIFDLDFSSGFFIFFVSIFLCLSLGKRIIQINVNKLTNENYCEISNEIKMVIKDIVDQNEEQYLSKIGVSIFEIGSANRFLSKVYVKLYKELIDTYPIMKNVCTSNFNSFQSLFETFDYCDANENYDRFCDVTKQNEKRKALSKFLMICVEYNIIELESMERIILYHRLLIPG